MMEWYEAALLGVVQGLTEFLPVSSSGHLEIGNALLGTDGQENLTFAVVVHAATVLSTLTILWSEVWKLLRGTFAFRWNEQTQYVAKIALSMIPVGIVGLCFKDQVEAIFGSGLLIVGVMLFVTASLLTFTYYARPRQKENLSFGDAFIIGLAQAVAVLPGLSRSGSTIATGILLGNKREQVAQFSFLMVIVPILGEAFLDLIKGGMTATATLPTTSLIAGFLAAYLSGCLACKWMVSIVKSGKLIYFAIYCALAGSFALTYHFMNA